MDDRQQAKVDVVTKKSYQVKHLDVGGGFGPVVMGSSLPGQTWERAEVLSDFVFPWTDAAAPETLFRALWDDENFFFRYEVVDADVVLGEGADAMEKVMASDRVEIFFTSGDDLNPYYGLEMDPRGEVLAYEARYHRCFHWDWTCPGLQVWPNLTGRGYTLEGVIPLETFRALGCLHQSEGGTFLKAGLFRAEFSHRADGSPVIEDWMAWVDPGVDTPDFHLPSAFGELLFVDG